MKGIKGFFIGVTAAAVLFVLLMSHMADQQRSHGRAVLEDAVRRSAAACYACEGFYPPDIAYLQQHYGLQYDEGQYLIHYQVFASNLMPDITVMERLP